MKLIKAQPKKCLMLKRIGIVHNVPPRSLVLKANAANADVSDQKQRAVSHKAGQAIGIARNVII